MNEYTTRESGRRDARAKGAAGGITIAGLVQTLVSEIMHPPHTNVPPFSFPASPSPPVLRRFLAPVDPRGQHRERCILFRSRFSRPHFTHPVPAKRQLLATECLAQTKTSPFY